MCIRDSFCSNPHAQIQTMPTEDFKLEFGGPLLNKQYLEEISIFYDLECLLRPKDQQNCSKCISICKCEADNTKKITLPKQEHEPIIYSYVIIDKNGEVLEQDTKYCPLGNAHIKLVSTLLDNQEKYLEVAKGKFKDLPFVHPHERNKIMKKQKKTCLHCHEKFRPGEATALDRM